MDGQEDNAGGELSVNLGGQTKQFMSDRKKKLLTACLFAAFMQFGSIAEGMGPTLLNLTDILGTNIRTITFAIMANSIGSLLGALLGGTFLLKYINQEIIIIAALGFASLAFAAAPWLPNVYLFIGFIFLAGLGGSCVEAISTAILLLMWGKNSDTWMQAMHLFFSIGATISPLIEEPFLEDMNSLKPIECLNNSHPTETPMKNLNGTGIFTTGYVDGNASLSQQNCENSTIYDLHLLGNVRYAYTILGGISFVTTLVFLTQTIKTKAPLKPYNISHVTENADKHDHERRKGFKVRIILTALLSIIMYCYVAHEVLYGNLISTFVVQELDMSIKDGATMTSIFWGCIGIGRLLAIPLSNFLRPSKILMMDFSLIAAATILMLFAVHESPVIPWIVSIITGLGMSSVFATVLTFGNRHMAIDGKVISVLLIAGAGGSITTSPLVGYLFDALSPMWLVYISCIMVSLEIISFIMMEITVNIHEKNTQKTCSMHTRSWEEKTSYKDLPTTEL